MGLQYVEFDIVRLTLEERLRKLGLTPRREGDCVVTGLDYCHISTGESQVLRIEDEEDCFASVEFNAVLKNPKFGEAVISDMVTNRNASAETALTRCAGYYMDVTFPALHALFDSAIAAAMPKMQLVSYTQPDERVVNWQVFTGQLQTLGIEPDTLAGLVGSTLPISLVIDTITSYLSTPRLHWCKLYGALMPTGELIFGCSINNYKSPEAEAEMRRKFPRRLQPMEPWEFREFFVFLPDGKAADENVAAELRRLAAGLAQPRKKWWPLKKKS